MSDIKFETSDELKKVQQNCRHSSWKLVEPDILQRGNMIYSAKYMQCVDCMFSYQSKNELEDKIEEILDNYQIKYYNSFWQRLINFLRF